MLIKKPLYHQVYALLVEQILSNKWPKGTSLPNEYQLSSELGVSIGTLRKAIDLLVEDHLVDRRQGKGTFIIDRISPEMRRGLDPIRNADGSPIDWRFADLDIQRASATAEEAKLLSLPEGGEIMHVWRLRLVGTRPTEFEHALLPAGRVGALEGKSARETTIVSLASVNDIPLSTAYERADVRPVSERGAKALRIAPGTAILRLRRIVRDTDLRPVEWRIAECHLDQEYYSVPVFKPSRQSAPADPPRPMMVA